MSAMEKIVALCQGGIFATVVREDLESLLQRICSQLTTAKAVDSEAMFADLEISKNTDFKELLVLV